MKTKAIIGAILLFLAGIVLGAGGSLAIVKWRVDQIRETAPRAIPAFAAERISHAAGLDDTERRALRKILRNLMIEVRAARRATAPQIQAAITEAEQEIRDTLPPEKAEQVLGLMQNLRTRSPGEPRKNSTNPTP